MSIKLAGFPSSPQHSIVASLDKLKFKVVYTWRQRCASWYFDLYREDGTTIILGRRMSPRAMPIELFAFEADTAPAGKLICMGPDEYVRESLGDRLFLLYISEAEASALSSGDSELVVVDHG